VLVHTGQHYDENMSRIFFEQLNIPEPQFNLEISGGNHGSMTGRMLEAIEQVLMDESPEWVLVYGDTNSTLAGALAAVKLHVPVAHVEAGLRSFNMRMPEEVNRIITDRVSSLLFCPTDTAVRNLRAEGITEQVHNIGDVMYDVALLYRKRAKQSSKIIEVSGLVPGAYALATCHRAENTDDPAMLATIVTALGQIAERLPVVLPLHPRTRKLISSNGLRKQLAKVSVVDPLSFFDMLALEQDAMLIITDSGGVQKEAFFYGVPCITMRDQTEWLETIEAGANQLVGASVEAITSAVDRIMNNPPFNTGVMPYGRGNAANLIVELFSAKL